MLYFFLGPFMSRIIYMKITCIYVICSLILFQYVIHISYWPCLLFTYSLPFWVVDLRPLNRSSSSSNSSYRTVWQQQLQTTLRRAARLVHRQTRRRPWRPTRQHRRSDHPRCTGSSTSCTRRPRTCIHPTGASLSGTYRCRP